MQHHQRGHRHPPDLVEVAVAAGAASAAGGAAAADAAGGSGRGLGKGEDFPRKMAVGNRECLLKVIVMHTEKNWEIISKHLLELYLELFLWV